eukprot:TRINITY_DN6167_c2_g2_i1.p1 TRINITY_DN6167_c2_g2~~TRINITY_DN6167_c2_g2_i1.p1  ORF type:complete len:455 (-),score=143.03 TRINITY_DN6167_c2_g2_i1:14-1378(-)
MSLLLQPPNWIPDEKVSSCETCLELFSFFNRKHHCRGCGRVFCANCSSFYIQLPSNFNYDSPQRVCKACFQKFNEVLQQSNHAIDDATKFSLFILRELKYRVSEQICLIGRRTPPIKSWFIISATNSADEKLMTITQFSNEMKVKLSAYENQIKQLNSLINSPFVNPILHFELRSARDCIVVMREFENRGSLKDVLFGNSYPKQNYGVKYDISRVRPMRVDGIQKAAAQILQGLIYLNSIGIPFVHLHLGNVIVNNKNCCITEYENSFLGIAPYYTLFSTKIIPELECFSYVIYEMGSAKEKKNDYLFYRKLTPSDNYFSGIIKSAKDSNTPNEIISILEKIYACEIESDSPVCTLNDLTQDPFLQANITTTTIPELNESCKKFLVEVQNNILTVLTTQRNNVIDAAISKNNKLSRQNSAVVRSVSVDETLAKSDNTSTTPIVKKKKKIKRKKK